jgi:ATP-dependent Clp protease protease subunit
MAAGASHGRGADHATAQNMPRAPAHRSPPCRTPPVIAERRGMPGRDGHFEFAYPDRCNPMYARLLAEKGDKKPDEESAGMLGRLLASRTVLVSGAVDSKMASKVIQQLILLEHDDEEKRITLLVNSPGGEFHSGFAIYDMIQFVSAPVISVVVGLAASMGSIIPLAVPKKCRYALPNSKFLIHQPLLMGYQGRASDLEIQAREILRDRERVVEIYGKHTGRKADDIAKDIDRDKWMTAKEALDYGLIDKIVTNRKEISA